MMMGILFGAWTVGVAPYKQFTLNPKFPTLRVTLKGKQANLYECLYA